MAGNDRYGAPKTRRKKRSLFAPLVFLLILAAIVFGMGVFFRVQSIEVVGAASYTDEQIIEASGIDIGDNLFFIDRFAASSRIFNRLPLVEEASIERSFPNKLIINIDESYAMAYVDWEGQHWLMTGSCKLLGSGDDGQLGGLIHVLHVTPSSPEAGHTMEVEEDESLKLSYIQSFLRAAQLVGVASGVSELDMENPADPTFRYLDRFTVKLGPNDNIEYKLRMLLSAVDQMESDITGLIDLSEGTAVHVSPD